MKRLNIFFATIIALLTFWHNNADAQDFIYLMPSKEIVETGENFFFKAYLIDRQTFALSDRSQTLYLQLRTASDSVVWSEKYPLVSGRANGHIYIGAEWSQGEYFMEGYSKSSFTTDSTQAIRPRRIRVVERVAQMDSISFKAVEKDGDSKKYSKHRFDLFPEGGHLIYGIYSVVAFKATYGNGMPEEVSGTIHEDGKKIGTIKTLHDGTGQFSVTPKSGKEYKVVLDDGRTIPFPNIEQGGMSLRVSKNNAKGLTLLVSSSEKAPQNFSITAKQNGIVRSSAKGIVEGQQIVKIPAEFFELQGIVEITLFDDLKRPVAERLVYVNPEQQLTITATTNQKQYNRRDMGKVRLQVTDISGNPVKSELAISIFDKAYLYQPGHENILSHCFLSEQIRGNIFNPTYYFDNKNDIRLQSLDLLLLTQGWRNYVWDKETPSSDYLLTDGVDGRLITQREVSMKTLVISGYAPQVDTSFVILTDTTGKFSIDPLLMYHTPGNIYLNDLLEDKYKAKFYVENMFDTINEYRHNLPHYIVDNQLIQTNNSERIKLDENVILIKEVVVTDKRGVIYRDKETGYLDSLAVLKSGEWVCDCDTIMPFLNDYKGYSHHPKDSPMEAYYGKRRIPKRGEKYQLIEIKETCVQPDNFGEVPIFATPYQADPTKSLRARHAKGPEFIIWAPVDEPRRGFVYPGPQYTEKEMLELYGIAKVQGYYPKREFYQPDSLDIQSPMPDPRNLLQWQPEVITDDNGTAEIPFAASDINTEFIGIVEAIDGNGLMGYQTFTFRVLKKGK
ncbi:MAG: hypothetical protein J6T60_16280 [Bacteroidales bacterium]|nr:hypothetical protein [Bacteroidales bacterium]